MLKLLSCWCLTLIPIVLLAQSGYGVEKAGSDSLKILVYGATGKIGTHVVSEALNRGHVVTAVSRDPSRITQIHDNLTAVQGNILDTESIASLAG